MTTPVYTTPTGVMGGVDDPNNASGLGAPAIIRGTVYAHLCAGVTVGSGNSGTVQTATGVGLQAGITYAAAHNLIFQINPGTYEINNVLGLVIPPGDLFKWKGFRGQTIITQFYATTPGAPILTLGNSSTATFTAEIDGVMLLYGASQTGFTSANALVINQTGWCTFKNIAINQGGGFSQYNSIVIGTSSFSCTWSDITAVSAQQNHLLVNGGGSGSVFNNIHLSQGGVGTYNALAGNYVNWNSSGSDEMTFIQLNVEWGACNTPILVAENLGMKFVSLHVEGIEFTGSYPRLMSSSYSAVSIDSLDIADCIFRSANYSGVPAIFGDYVTGGASNITVNNMTWTVNSGSVNPGGAAELNAAVNMILPSSTTDYFPNFTINKFFARDTVGSIIAPNLQFDTHMPVSASAFQFPAQCGMYNYGPGGSSCDKAEINISATYTHYGQYTDATILVPATVTGFTLTLSNVMGATGTQNVKNGNTVHVRRMAGTASGTLLVKDDAGTTLTTSTTQGVDYFYQFTGTHYVLFTPVT